MKKIILTSLLGLFGFVGAFASADYTFQGAVDGETYTPSQLVLTEDLTFDNSNISYTLFDGQSSSSFTIADYPDTVLCYIELYNDSLTLGGVPENGEGWSDGYCFIPAGTYVILGSTGFNFASFTISPSDSGNGGTEGDDNTNGSLISNGTGSFSGIINSLGTTISEFIPYVVYIGLGLLGAVIGFVAIKRLMNYTRRKVLGTFSSRKRR